MPTLMAVFSIILVTLLCGWLLGVLSAGAIWVGRLERDARKYADGMEAMHARHMTELAEETAKHVEHRRALAEFALLLDYGAHDEAFDVLRKAGIDTEQRA